MHNPNKIIHNTGFLYLRMLLTMAIMLYTSRVLLDILGAEDFGLYHVLAGVVMLLGFLQGALATMTQRFIAMELGREDTSQLTRIFSVSVMLHLIFAAVVAVVALLVGYVWLVDFINYGEKQAEIVFWVFVLAIGSFVINLAALPCHAVIVAHERMKAFAWFGIFEAVLKLLIVFVLPLLTVDPLLAYAGLLLAVSLLMASIYFAYVLRRFESVTLRWLWDAQLLRTLASFSGWSMWGSAAAVLANQGTNLLLNVFFGPAVNAAKSIGTQASGALNQFVINLQSAINPQLVKSYSADDLEYTDKLVYYGAKYNFFLIALLALPVLVYTDEILKLWLVAVPDYASIFLRIMLITVVVDSIAKPLMTAAQATGRIKLYQAVVGGILLLNIPLSLLLLASDIGFGPEIVFYVALGVVVVASVARVVMLKRIYNFSAWRFIVAVLWPVSGVVVVLALWAYAVSSLLPINSFSALVLAVLLLMLGTLASIFLVGLTTTERRTLLASIREGSPPSSQRGRWR